MLLCPFCGGDGEERTWDDRLPDGTPFIRHAIKCRDCGASTRWVSTGADALRAWALRAAPQPGDGALREAEDPPRAWRNRAPESWSLAARTRRWLADRTGTAQ